MVLASALVPICGSCGQETDSDFRFCPYCAAPLPTAAPAREQRKTVTVLFCDVAGSTALGESKDPEALRTLLARYFARMRGIVESHGGTVEKFIGDAVMAVFGVPTLHEDDAIRACRAAVEMRDAFPELGINGRIGVTTGEVVTGTVERLATGDAVNVAARLERAAAPGEVLIGAETLALARDAVAVTSVEPLTLKGKADPVPAFRLISAHGELVRRFAAPMVGRETELRRLREAVGQAARDRSCQLFTVLGAAGVGKSRLVAESLCVLDDLHWAEETLLDLVEHVAELSQDAPVVLLCIARPELLERRPAWGGVKSNSTTVLLEPLDAAETERLLDELGGVDPGLRERIATAAGGNPLFLEEMLALVRESRDAEISVPPTIQALLAARLDQLAPAERSVLERGSVEGYVFHRSAVQALVNGEPLAPLLDALVSKQLILPDIPQFDEEKAYRFHHLLIRDAAYDALTKSARADLHERFAEWLEERAEDLVELDEILGHHLERAARYKTELEQPDSGLGERAAERLAAAGRRALARGDERAAASLLERALALTRPVRFDVHLELELAEAVRADHRQAVAIAERTAERAAVAGDLAGEALARVVAARHRMEFAPDPRVDEIDALARTALPLLERADDHAGLVHVWNAISESANHRGRWAKWGRSREQAVHHARLAGKPTHPLGLGTPYVLGPEPADELLQKLDQLPESAHPGRLLNRARLLAMLDRFAEAWPLALEASERLRELTGDDGGEQYLAAIATLAGDHETAARYLRIYCDRLETQGYRAFLATYAPMLGRSLTALDRYEEAERCARRGRALGDEKDPSTQALWRQVQALVNAHRGQHADAERLAREAVEIMEGTDSLTYQGDALWDLADVLTAGGSDEAGAALTQALDRYERKRNLAMARRVQERLAE